MHASRPRGISARPKDPAALRPGPPCATAQQRAAPRRPSRPARGTDLDCLECDSCNAGATLAPRSTVAVRHVHTPLRSAEQQRADEAPPAPRVPWLALLAALVVVGLSVVVWRAQL